jgi:hypothetical protein
VIPQPKQMNTAQIHSRRRTASMNIHSENNVMIPNHGLASQYWIFSKFVNSEASTPSKLPDPLRIKTLKSGTEIPVLHI